MITTNFSTEFKKKVLDAFSFKHVASDSVKHNVGCTYALQMKYCQGFDLHQLKLICEKLAKEFDYCIISSVINATATQYHISIVNHKDKLSYRIQVAVALSDFEAVVLNFVKIEIE